MKHAGILSPTPPFGRCAPKKIFAIEAAVVRSVDMGLFARVTVPAGSDAHTRATNKPGKYSTHEEHHRRHDRS
jgi:hypothetical protein